MSVLQVAGMMIAKGSKRVRDLIGVGSRHRGESCTVSWDSRAGISFSERFFHRAR